MCLHPRPGESKMMYLGSTLGCSALSGHQMSPCLVSRWGWAQPLVSKQEDQRQGSSTGEACRVQRQAAVCFPFSQWFLLWIYFSAQQHSCTLPVLQLLAFPAFRLVLFSQVTAEHRWGLVVFSEDLGRSDYRNIQVTNAAFVCLFNLL